MVNLIHAQFTLFDKHSTNTYMLQTIDIIVHLIHQGIEPYVYAGMRTTTARLNMESQTLFHHEQ